MLIYKKKVVGHKEFKANENGKCLIDVTDPCYEHGTWCQKTDLEIVPGNYACVAWKNGKNVGGCGIYLNGYVGRDDEFEDIASIDVDSGLAGFFQNKPDYSNKEWCDFCEKVYPNNKTTKSEWIFPEGFFTVSGSGDGCYPVLARKGCSGKNKGKIVGVEIWFDCYDGDDEEDEEFGEEGGEE